MIVAFTGWRAWEDAPFIRADIDGWLAREALRGTREVPVTVRVGDCPTGADLIIRDWLYGVDGIALVVYAADWTNLGKAAGPHRNRQMLEGQSEWDATAGKPADLLIGYPQPGIATPYKNSGTWNCITQAHYRGIEVRLPAYRPSAEALRENADPLLPFAVAGER